MLDYFIKYYIELSLGITFILTNFLFCLAITLVMNGFKFDKKGIIIKIIDFILTCVLMILLSSIYYFFFKNKFIEFVVWPILILSHSFILNKYTLFNRLIKFFVLSTCFILSLRLTSTFGFILFNNTPSASIIINLILVTGVVIIFKALPLESINTFSFSILIAECVMFVIAISEIIINDELFDFTSNDVLEKALYGILMLGLYFIAILNYFFFYWETKNHQKALDTQNKLFKLEMDKKSSYLSSQNLEDLRKLRHDMKNQYQYLRVLLKEKDYEKLDSFLSDIFENSFVPITYVDCGNSIVSGAMNIEIHKAHENDINIKHNLIIPKSFDLADLDVYRLITNILDNAIESVAREKIENATIDVDLSYKDSYLVFKISNPVTDSLSKEERLAMKSQKGKNHGYGKKIIKDIVKTYHGYIKEDVIDNKYISEGMLYIEVKNE